MNLFEAINYLYNRNSWKKEINRRNKNKALHEQMSKRQEIYIGDIKHD